MDTNSLGYEHVEEGKDCVLWQDDWSACVGSGNSTARPDIVPPSKGP